MSSAEIWRLVITASITSAIIMVVSTLLGGYLALCWFERKRNRIANKVKKAFDGQNFLLQATDKLREYVYRSWRVRRKMINLDQIFWREFKKNALLCDSNKSLLDLFFEVEKVYDYLHMGIIIYGNGKDAEKRVTAIKRFIRNPINQKYEENVFFYIWEYSNPEYSEKNVRLLGNISEIEFEISKLKL